MSRSKPNFDKPCKVALFQNMEWGSYSVMELPDYSTDDDWALDGYVRISDWALVTLIPLSSAETLGTALIAMGRIREKVVNEFAGKLAVIDERIANLRCLPAPSME